MYGGGGSHKRKFFTNNIFTKKEHKKIIAVLIIPLLVIPLLLSDLPLKAYGTIITEGDWTVPGDYVEGGLEEYTFTVTQTGNYYFELTGGTGGLGYLHDHNQRISNYAWGGIGGSVQGVATLTAGDIVTVGIEAGGGSSHAWYTGDRRNDWYNGGGGAAIYVAVNDDMLIGAGGGGGKASLSPNSVPPANISNSGTFGSGGGCIDPGGYKNAVSPQGSAGTGGAAGTRQVSGQSGANYFDESRLIEWNAPNINRTPGFKITLMSTTNGIYNRSDILTTSYAISTMDNNGDSGFVFAGTVSKDARVTETGNYIIECSGEGGTGFGGRIIAEVYLEAGDFIQGNIVPGGVSYWGDVRAVGGKATLISVNGTPVLGAGGGGGYGYYKNGSSNLYGNGGSVTTINNSTFGSGGGGGYQYWTSGSPSNKTVPGGLGSAGAGGGAYGAEGGAAGSNYLNDSLATVISNPNDGREAYYIITKKETRDYIPKISTGKYADMGMLTVVNDTLETTDNCQTFTAQLPYASYEIYVKGGRYGGVVQGNIMLKQGDKLFIEQILTYMEGGNGGYTGGSAVLVFLKDAFTGQTNLITGAGGGAVNANGMAAGQTGGNTTIYYNNGEYSETVGAVGSQHFGSGGSSVSSTPGMPGADGLIYDEFGNGANPGEGAANFVDTGYFTSYTSSANSGLTTPTGSFTITLMSLGTPDQIAAIETLKNITDLQKRLTVLEAPIIVCQNGKPFETRIHTYSKITSAAVEGISVINTDLTDGYIIVKGTLTGTGYRDIYIEGLKFTFKILEEPNSSNVTVVFD